MTKVLTVAFLILGVSCTQRAEEHPIKTTVCSIAADPQRFDGRLVSVWARFESDGFEHSSLVDPACLGSIIAVSAGPSEDRAHRRLSEAIFKRRPGTFDKDIHGTFTGTFRWSPKRGPRRTIELKTASQVSVKPKTQSAAPRRKDDKPVEVTVCEVAADPSGFDERLVRMRAQVESDGREHTRLSDRRCRSAWITVASRPSPGADLRELKDVLFGKESGTLDREVTATLVGRIRTNAIEEVGVPRSSWSARRISPSNV